MLERPLVTSITSESGQNAYTNGQIAHRNAKTRKLKKVSECPTVRSPTRKNGNNVHQNGQNSQMHNRSECPLDRSLTSENGQNAQRNGQNTHFKQRQNAHQNDQDPHRLENTNPTKVHS